MARNLGIPLVLMTSALFSYSAQAKLERFAQVDATVYRGSRPIHEEDYQELREDRIKTILNLEVLPHHIEEGKAGAEKHGLKFISIPILPIESPIPLAVMQAVLNVLRDPALQPVYFHCLLGSDRTGLAAAMYRIHVQRWSFQEAYDEMLSYGFKPHFLPGLEKFFEEHKILGSLKVN